jgi:hypothetical protein
VGGREELGPLAPALEGAGITLGAAKHAQTRPSQFETISWVDFDHAIFAPFQGTRYNDFTVIRLYNHLNAQVDEPARVIARSDEDAPVMAETALGEGRVVVWPFALRLDWTNLPKTQRFVPLAFETLAYASGWEEIAGEFIVGQTLPGAALDYSAGGQCEILLPGESKQRTITAETAGDIRLERPGRFLARASGASGWTESRAVNVDAREGNPERLEPETLLARVATSSVLDEQAGVAGIVGADVDPQGYAIDKEYGRWALIAVCGLVLIECLYMSRLSARARQTGRTAQVQAAP